MELLSSTLFILLLLTTASAKPAGRDLHHDADITDKAQTQGWMDWWLWRSSDPSNYHRLQDSSESSESSESSDSSEEVLMTDETTEPETTTAAMTTMTSGDGTATPEPATMGTNLPIMETTTPPTGTPATPVEVTSLCGVTDCVTVDIPTEAPVTESRGDN